MICKSFRVDVFFSLVLSLTQSELKLNAEIISSSAIPNQCLAHISNIVLILPQKQINDIAKTHKRKSTLLHKDHKIQFPTSYLCVGFSQRTSSTSQTIPSGLPYPASTRLHHTEKTLLYWIQRGFKAERKPL